MPPRLRRKKPMHYTTRPLTNVRGSHYPISRSPPPHVHPSAKNRASGRGGERESHLNHLVDSLGAADLPRLFARAPPRIRLLRGDDVGSKR